VPPKPLAFRHLLALPLPQRHRWRNLSKAMARPKATTYRSDF
jgi:hypothetical protein